MPDDVAERLAKEPNVSAFIAGSVRRVMAGDRTRQSLREVGFVLTDAGLAEAGRKLDEALPKEWPIMDL
ncbi:hypothetical protein [Micromonospora sp. NPDC005171]|uniref:hypothetical protein n=1 Tax=Micromonospora sp. NPDC005171 TaxID=3156866 RepID=UPI0033B327A3